jgi:hypothetical protein
MITAPGVIGVAQLQQGARREHKGSKMEVSDNMGMAEVHCGGLATVGWFDGGKMVAARLRQWLQ